MVPLVELTKVLVEHVLAFFKEELVTAAVEDEAGFVTEIELEVCWRPVKCFGGNEAIPAILFRCVRCPG
jgi:hypothetical protein